jgi:hypothetical protein
MYRFISIEAKLRGIKPEETKNNPDIFLMEVYPGIIWPQGKKTYILPAVIFFTGLSFRRGLLPCGV